MHSIIPVMTKVFLMLQRDTERAENKCQMYGLGVLSVFPE